MLDLTSQSEGGTERLRYKLQERYRACRTDTNIKANTGYPHESQTLNSIKRRGILSKLDNMAWCPLAVAAQVFTLLSLRVRFPSTSHENMAI